MKSGIIWRRTFPECAPGTDGVALFEGRAIGRVRLLAEPREKPWMWSVTDCGSRRQAMERLIERWQELRRHKPT